MPDMSEAIFASINTLYVNDTGAGGLNETDGDAQVRHFIRQGDPNFSQDRTYNWPLVSVGVFNNESRVFTKRRVEAIVRMSLFTNRDDNTSGLTRQYDVAQRMYELFDGATLTAQTGVAFSLLNQLRDFQGPSSGVELHRVFEYSVYPIATG